MPAPDENGYVRAFGGLGQLKGDRMTRIVYIDESGISFREPFAVVCGVMVDGDKELVKLENHLFALVKKHIPDSDQDGFVFHATNIFSGTKYFKNEEEWPLKKRIAILDDLVKIPTDFGLPVSLGFVYKPEFRSIIPSGFLKQEPTEKDINIAAHGVAFAMCTIEIERAMREALPDEIALMVAENTDFARRSIKESHAIYRSEKQVKLLGIEIDCFPLTKIRDTVHFAEKHESRLLQLADVCAFVMMGHLTRHKLNQRFYDALKPVLLMEPKENARLPV